MGQAARTTKGKADPKVAKELLLKLLGNAQYEREQNLGV